MKRLTWPETQDLLLKRAPWIGLGFCVCLAALLHGPALQRLGTHLPGEPGSDVLRAWWSAWLVAAELPGWPFSTTLVNFPAGVDALVFPAVSLIAVAPITWVFGAATAITALVCLHTVFAAWATGWLVRTLGGGWGGAAIAGALAATQPLLGGALRDGTVEILAVGWVPLTLGAMVRAVAGSWRWGVITGLLFVLTCLESVYYGSFTALAVIAALAGLRRREGLVGGAAAALTVAVGLGLLAVPLGPVLQGAAAAMATAGEGDPSALRATNAAQLDLLQQLAMSPGARGWRVGDLYAPPWTHWIAFALGALLALRKAPWLTALGGVYLLLALDDNLVRPWAESPIGEVVRFPRRFMAPLAVAWGAAAGVGLSEILRKPALEGLVSLPIAAWLAWWGAIAGGWRLAYPLLELPAPSFVAQIAEDDEDCAVLMVPIERPGERQELRSQTPVFASLSAQIASADHLALQTLMGKAGWYKPNLVTLTASSGATGLTPKNLTDLALQAYGRGVPGSALLPADAYGPDLAWLMGEGLKYVVVDKASYRAEELARVEAILAPVAVRREELQDGTGVILFQLYETRPERTEAPSSSAGALNAGFSGRVMSIDKLFGRLFVVVSSDGKKVRCPVTPGTGIFQCGGVRSVQGVALELEGMVIPSTWEGSLLEARVIPTELSGP
ncbi:MAG: hypothetical protein IPI35_14375 [Deltaproteobacteria bacterium]|nr:hypothetical protein [Deltaproteobacteria bacterium]